MPITDVDPSTLGSFDPTNIVLQHDDTVSVNQWTRHVENGATSYSMWRDAIANSRPFVFGHEQYSCIPPTPVGVTLVGGLAEKAAIRYSIVWQTTSGSDNRGKVRLMGGTDLAALGTLDEHLLGALSGTYYGSAADPIDVPQYAISGGSTWAPPYWLVIETDNPPGGAMLASSLSVRYTRYPVIP
jgi:hypothetical protein